jgi:hypothetical protein
VGFVDLLVMKRLGGTDEKGSDDASAIDEFCVMSVRKSRHWMDLRLNGVYGEDTYTVSKPSQNISNMGWRTRTGIVSTRGK